MKFQVRQVQTKSDEFAIPVLRTLVIASIRETAQQKMLDALPVGGSLIAVGNRMAELLASVETMTRAELESFDAKALW